MNRLRVSLVALVVGAAVVGAAGVRLSLSAQQPSISFPLLLGKEEAESLRRAWNERLPYIPGELLVKFRAGTDPFNRGRALSVLRGSPSERQEQWIGDALLVRSSEDLDSEAAAIVVGRQAEVEWAHPNYFRRFQAVPNDPSFSRQWNLSAIKVPQAWDINPGASESVVVAVVDSGVTAITGTYVFQLWTGSRFEAVPVPVAIVPDIAQARMVPGRDFIFWGGPVIDFDGHGTHVAGTALEETNDGVGLAGIAYRAKLMPLKACIGYWDLQFIDSALGIPGFVDPRETGGCSDSALAQALRYAADNGVQVINLSVGGLVRSPVIDDAVRYAASKNVFIAIASGNDFEIGNRPNYPAATAASIDGAVAVGAVGRSSRRAFYSNTSSSVEVVAPGGDVRDGAEVGLIYQASLFPPDSDPRTVIRPRFDRYAEVPEQGTSMAAPHVAGVAALLYSQGINRASAIEVALKRYAVDLGTSGRDDDFGHGLIDARASLRGMGLAR